MTASISSENSGAQGSYASQFKTWVSLEGREGSSDLQIAKAFYHLKNNVFEYILEVQR